MLAQFNSERLFNRGVAYSSGVANKIIYMINNSKIFVDTSAFYAVSETIALLQKKIGFEAANVWYRDILGVLDICWIDEDTHQRAYELWLNLGRRKLSLVDCVSFITMHHHQIEKAFCFKQHFVNHGFDLLTVSSNS